MDINKRYAKWPTAHTVCVVGVGNPLRGDDGVGNLVCQHLENKNLRDVDIIRVHQLDLVMAEKLSLYDVVIFVDASISGQTGTHIKAVDTETEPVSLSHHVNIPVIAGLCKKLYSSKTRFYYCAIEATSFEPGNLISPTTWINMEKAVEEILIFIHEERD